MSKYTDEITEITHELTKLEKRLEVYCGFDPTTSHNQATSCVQSAISYLKGILDDKKKPFVERPTSTRLMEDLSKEKG